MRRSCPTVLEYVWAKGSTPTQTPCSAHLGGNEASYAGIDDLRFSARPIIVGYLGRERETTQTVRQSEKIRQGDMPQWPVRSFQTVSHLPTTPCEWLEPGKSLRRWGFHDARSKIFHRDGCWLHVVVTPTLQRGARFREEHATEDEDDDEFNCMRSSTRGAVRFINAQLQCAFLFDLTQHTRSTASYITHRSLLDIVSLNTWYISGNRVHIHV